MPGRKRKAAAAHAASDPADPDAAGGLVVQVTQALDGDRDFNSVVLAMRSGADIALQQSLMHALASALDALTSVQFDAPTLDQLFTSVTELEPEGLAALQGEPQAMHLVTYLFGVLAGPRAVAFRAGKVYLALLTAYGSNATLILNSFFVRKILTLVQQFLTTCKSEEGGEQPPAMTQGMTQGMTQASQQSIHLTPDVPASQWAAVPASQKPAKKRKVTRRKAASEIPSDWGDAYEAALHVVKLFENARLRRALGADLAAHCLEAVAALPQREMAGPLRAAGLVPVKSKLWEVCFEVLTEAMKGSETYEVYDMTANAPPPPPAEGDGGDKADGADDEEATAREVTAQELILPHFLPLLHLAPVYTSGAVKLSDAVALQKAVFDVIAAAGLSADTMGLLYRLFLFSPEKRPRSEPLAAACSIGVRLLLELPQEVTTPCVEYLAELSASSQTHHRLFAVEVGFGMLTNGDVLQHIAPDAAQAVADLLFKRVNDMVAIVRTKALGNLSKIMLMIGAPDCPTRAPISAYLTRLRSTPLNPTLAPPTHEVGKTATAAAAEAAGTGDPQGRDSVPPNSATRTSSATPNFHQRGSLASNVSRSPEIVTISCSEMDYLLASVVARTREEKALVRKAGIDLLLQFFEHTVVQAASVTSAVIELMSMKSEPSVLVRRQAVLCAWKIILRFTQPSQLHTRSKMFTAVVTNYGLETEDFVLKMMLQCVKDLVILPLTEEDGHGLTADEVWELLATFTDSQVAALGRMCCKLLEEGEVDSNIVQSLLDRIDHEPASRDAWSMLPLFAKKYNTAISAQTVLKSFQVLKPAFTRGDARQHTVLTHVLSLLPDLALNEAQQAGVVSVLEQLVLSLGCAANLVHAAVNCYARLMKESTVQRLAAIFVNLCSAMLYNLLTGTTAKDLSEDVVRAGLTKVTLKDLPVAICTMGCLVLTDAFKANPLDLAPVAEMIAAVCNTAIPDAEHATALPFKAIPTTVLMHAYLCQVRLCLYAKQWCKKGVPILLKGLASSEVCVKTVCLNGLTDLSMKYPGTVDKFLPNLSATLSDADVRVRLTALTLITQLLGESFLKLRPFLFFEVLGLVADVNENVGAFARYSLLKVMLPKDPFLVTNNIKETLFVLNNYPFHPKYNKMTRPITRFCGDLYQHPRLQLMRFLISQVTAEKDILRVYEQLHDVLEMCSAEGSDGATLNVGCAEGVGVFKDTLLLLMAPEMNLASRNLHATKKATAQDTSGDDPEEEEAEEKMRKALWTGVVTGKVREMVCPILVSVSMQLREARSPLLRELLHYAAYILQDEEAKLDELISHPQLAKEIKRTLDESRTVRGAGAQRRVPPLAPAAVIHSAATPQRRSTTPLAPRAGSANSIRTGGSTPGPKFKRLSSAPRPSTGKENLFPPPTC
eukprot:TRINITY_DN16660_c0_g1_i1.p1 TRINITY_DN16660_c0_g1~~TRINITY_DN16660_c0_g1_i1.p1  ORF type:complete len:1427 (+),score=607.49 TRINITY_DN16660_c0_g1_i1:81-4283(+)